jgi:preprotein translocase subunit SecG
MSFFIGLLMFVMVLASIALIFLVLIQLPKKEAGIGIAFGSGATDMIFGAGSGTVLTKMTKYLAVAFFLLALLVGALQSHFGKQGRAGRTTDLIQQQANQLPAPTSGQPVPGSTPAAIPGTSPTAPAPTTPATTPTSPPAETPVQK